MYVIELSNVIPEDVIPFFSDLSKLATIIVIAHVLFAVNDSQYAFFNFQVLELFLYLALGLAFYHLVVDQLVQFA